MATKISFGGGELVAATEPKATILVGKKSFLTKIAQDAAALYNAVDFDIDPALLSAAIDSVDGPSGSISALITGPEKQPHQLCLCVLPEETTRNNHPASVHLISDLVAKTCPTKGNVHIVIGGVTDDVPAGPLASAVARAFPLYSRKTKDGKLLIDSEKREVCVTLLHAYGLYAVTDNKALVAARVVADSVRLVGSFVDAPPEELTTTRFAEECRQAVEGLDSVTMTEIVGDELREKGYGGLFGVGKAAECPPRLVIMTYEPPSGEPTDVIALVGKGIVYDSGGLSLKSKTGMPGMKGDMGGAAGVLGGFLAAAQMGATQKIHLILCLAENAIGPSAFRNDDILTMYSGKTVEVNNTDAEGRLVLADGVAHATRHFDGLNLVVDMATLTGAQLIATGRKHAGVLANTIELEQMAVKAGIRSGDLCFPLLYAPELLQLEFKSEVADMKNSVKDRSNAQSSCAGHFIESHLADGYKGGWLHFDMAGPANDGKRATGYGVNLILSLLSVPGF